MANTKSIVKTKEAKEIKNSLMLSGSPLNVKQLMHMLQRTPKEHIYKRVGKGGGEFEYVTGTYMKKVLNYMFGWMWDFEVKSHGQEKDLVWVLGRLTIKDKKGNPMVIKEQFGRADVKYYKDRAKGTVDFGNDLKSAATDALKKCAAELGIASDVYGKGEFKEIQSKGYATQEEKPAQENKAAELMASESDVERIKKLWVECGIQKAPAGIEKLTKVRASELIFKLMERKARNKK